MHRLFFLLMLVVTGCQSESPTFQVPPGFDRLPFDRYSIDADGRASVDVDVQDLWMEENDHGDAEYFVDWDNGSDSNSGTRFSPLKTIRAAAQKKDVATIWLMPGIHYDGLDNYQPQNNIAIRAYSKGRTIIRMGEDPSEYSFSQVPGMASTYSAVVYRQIRAVFTNQYRELGLASGKEAVGNTAGSWFYDTTSKRLFIRTFDGNPPDDDVIMLTTSINEVEGDHALYLEGIRIEGGQHGFQATATKSGKPRLYIKNSEIYYAINFGVDSNGAETYLQNVEVAHSGLDNLNYHSEGTTQPLAVEIDVTSRGAGRGEIDEFNNASSMHDSGVIARVNGVYYESYGPNLPDTNGSYSLNIGVTARNSKAPSSTQNVNFWSGSGGNGPSEMYCHECKSQGSTTDFYAIAARIFVSGGSNEGILRVEKDGLSSIESYSPSQQ